MKILHIVHNFYGFSGASLQAHNLASEINKKDNTIQQKFLNLGTSFRKNNHTLFEVYNSPINKISKILYFIYLLVQYKPNVIHFHGADFSLLLISKLFLKKIYWKTTLKDSDDFYTLTNGNLGYIKKKLLQLIDRNNSLTNQIYNINKKIIKEEKVVKIPNGVYIPITMNKKRDIAIIISAIIPRKSVIEGILYYQNHLSSLGYKLYIFGPIDPSLDGYDSEYAQNFLNIVNNNQNITYFDQVPHKVILDNLKDARVLIHLSSNEGMPNAVLEALSYGCFPIIKSMGGLAYEICDHTKTGLVIDDSIKFELSNIPLINTEGINFIKKNFAFDLIAEKTISLYYEIVNP